MAIGRENEVCNPRNPHCAQGLSCQAIGHVGVHICMRNVAGAAQPIVPQPASPAASAPQLFMQQTVQPSAPDPSLQLLQWTSSPMIVIGLVGALMALVGALVAIAARRRRTHAVQR